MSNAHVVWLLLDSKWKVYTQQWGCKRRRHLFWGNVYLQERNLTEILPDFPGVSFAELPLSRMLSSITGKDCDPRAGPRLPGTRPAWDRPRRPVPRPQSVLEAGGGGAELQGRTAILTVVMLYYLFKDQALRLPCGPVLTTSPSNAGAAGSIPGQGAKISRATWPQNQNVKQKQYCNNVDTDRKTSFSTFETNITSLTIL